MNSRGREVGGRMRDTTVEGLRVEREGGRDREENREIWVIRGLRQR